VPDNDLTIVREYSGIQVVLDWLQVFEKVLGRPMKVSQADLESRNEAEQRSLLNRCLVNEGLLPHRSDPETLRGQLQTFAAALGTHYKPSGVYEGNMEATEPGNDNAETLVQRQSLAKELVQAATEFRLYSVLALAASRTFTLTSTATDAAGN